jgi:hypothetical protein
MRRLWIAAGMLAASCVLAGCGDGGTSTVTPEETKSVLEALKKVDPHPELKIGKTGKGASTKRR